MTTAEDKLERARALGLTSAACYYMAFALRRKWHASTDISTMATTKRGNFLYNPAFIQATPLAELVYVLCHEARHVLDLDFERIGHRKPDRWNIAADARINSDLDRQLQFAGPEQRVLFDWVDDLTKEEIYDRLPAVDDQQESEPDIGAPDPEGEPDQQEQQEITRKIAEDTVRAAAAVKVMGRGIPSFIEEIIENNKKKKKVDWRDLLRDALQRTMARGHHWRRLNPRRSYTAPVRRRDPSLGTVVAIVDTSGSMDEGELTECFAQVQSIIDELMPETLYVVQCDSAIRQVQEVAIGDSVSCKVYGRGGTDLRRGFDWIDDNDIEPDYAVILTDGDTPVPGHTDYPCIWAITTNKSMPDHIGEIIRIN